MSELLTNPSQVGVDGGYPQRIVVPDEFLDWELEMLDYDPTYYVSDHVLEKSGSEADLEDFRFTGHTFKSMGGELRRDLHDRPLNPLGRTGIAGRGKLYRWGPNRTADMILTRGYGDELEVVLGRRRDNKKLAIIGGFVDPGEITLQAAVRETLEEINIDLLHDIEELAPLIVCRGIVRHSTRMTDHAWIESTVYNVDATKTHVAEMEPIAGDDLLPGSAAWMRLSEVSLEDLHDDHASYLKQAAFLLSN